MMKSLFLEFPGMREKMYRYQLSGNMSENTIDDGESRHGGISPPSFHDNSTYRIKKKHYLKKHIIVIIIMKK